MSENQKVLVVGGSTYDITAEILGQPIPCDSNPSRIYGGAGGVGRNIAENIARMGATTSFISAFGSDAFSDELISSCRNVGMDVSQAIVSTGLGSSIYLSIMDKDGELQYGASDLTLMEQIDSSEFEKRRDFITSFPYLILDANLTEPMLRMLADMSDAKIITDAVSVPKSKRLRAILDRIDSLKVNILELSGISGREVRGKQEIFDAAHLLTDRGVNKVFVTMGIEGCCCITEHESVFLPAFPIKVKNVTGAGDAFTAAVTYGVMHRFSNEQILRLGTAASHIALQSARAVSQEMSEDLLLNTYQSICSLS